MKFIHKGWDVTIEGTAPTRTVTIAEATDPVKSADFPENHFGDPFDWSDEELKWAIIEWLDDEALRKADEHAAAEIRHKTEQATDAAWREWLKL